jgi:hypothetical protein
VLLNFVLTSISLYCLSLYKIPSWCLIKIDKIHMTFFMGRGWIRVLIDI